MSTDITLARMARTSGDSGATARPATPLAEGGFSTACWPALVAPTPAIAELVAAPAPTLLLVVRVIILDRRPAPMLLCWRRAEDRSLAPSALLCLEEDAWEEVGVRPLLTESFPLPPLAEDPARALTMDLMRCCRRETRLPPPEAE
jgi:hypothetical protein